MHKARLHILRPGEIRKGPVVYWMSREQRVRDNWALIHAQETALKQKAPLLVIFCLVADFLKATRRQYHFMLQGNPNEVVPENLILKLISHVSLHSFQKTI